MIAPELNDRLILTYGTLLYREQLEPMLPRNAALADLALRLRASEPGVDKSNSGGWHSEGNVFARPEAEIAELARHVQAALQYVCGVSEQVQGQAVELKASLVGWFNVNGPGAYNTPHHHSGNTWSGVYYVRVGSASDGRPIGGDIELMDPRVRCDVGPKHGFSHSGSMAITPRDGMLLVFPSYLEHFVHPYTGDGERVTLAFNSLVQSMQPAG